MSSSRVESLIKQINHRVKATAQFWKEGGREAVLQVRAASPSAAGVRAESPITKASALTSCADFCPGGVVRLTV